MHRLSNRTVTLEDCLQAFCTKEELMGADRYRCEHCKTLNDSQKFLRIAQPPEVQIYIYIYTPLLAVSPTVTSSAH
jgi:ubiquitin C-terminal hydrolase